MAQQILLSSDKKRVTAAQGARAEFGVTIQNLTTLLDDVTVTVGGVDASWVQVIPAHVPVFAQGEASVRVILQPPLEPARAVAGVYPLQVKGRSQEFAGQEADVAIDFEIQFGGDYRLEIGAVKSTGAQEAAFPVKVCNEANAPLTLRLAGSDTQNAFWYKLEPFQLSIPAGGQGEALLTVRSRQSGLEAQTVSFTLTGQGEWTVSGGDSLGAPAHQVNGQWGQAAPTTLGVAVRPLSPAAGGPAQYLVQVSNPGPNPEAAGLEGSSADGRLGFQFDPPQLSLSPNSTAQSNLLVWQVNPAAGAGGQAVDFWVTARPLSARTRPGSIKAIFAVPAVPAKKRPKWVIPVVVGGALLLLACLAGVVVLVLMNIQ